MRDMPHDGRTVNRLISQTRLSTQEFQFILTNPPEANKWYNPNSSSVPVDRTRKLGNQEPRLVLGRNGNPRNVMRLKEEIAQRSVQS